ncbi:hypothetical protein FSP39_013808 [Pinctada imbricata]|uniref:Laminin G domain-containing protein n=1 Tax=Pinctada imbricata TaxID=66713 RepID=A0AA88XS34_PINIB|nr:hypothetical protein FSP39_013808 [Pinctada imbricata]
MRFRTTSPAGLLFWTGQNTSASAPSDFLALGFTDGVLQFRYNLGGGEVVISYNGSNLVDGQWHSIRAQRDKQDGYLEVDHRWIVEGSSPGKFSVLNTNKELYLGGALDTSLLTFGKFLTGFTGCISDVKLAEEYNINLVKGAHSGRNIQSCDIT